MDETVKAFVYGTLRMGEYNQVMDRDASFKKATAAGAIYHLNRYGRAYPVSKFDEDGTIIGEVHEYPSNRWRSICMMEIGAGYELRDVEVTYEDGSTEVVGAWHYIRDPQGPRIMSGDWTDRSDDPQPFDDDDPWDEDEDIEDG